MKDNVVMLVVAHKLFDEPEDRLLYQTILVGDIKNTNKNRLTDSDGDENIADKNAYYCELTAMYWAWKNLKCEYIGINHYRRYFMSPNKKEKKLTSIISKDEILDLLDKYDIVLPKKKILFPSSIKRYYLVHHYGKDLELIKNIIKEKTPEYLEAFDKTMRKKSMYVCNMIITNKDIYDRYCKWLFGILFEAEKRMDISEYSKTQQRVFGFLAERLLNVWIEKNNQLSVYELPMLSLEQKDYSFRALAGKARRHITNEKL